MRRVHKNLCLATISASIMTANMWKNSVKNVESDNNTILYEILLDFFTVKRTYFLNKPLMLVHLAKRDLCRPSKGECTQLSKEVTEKNLTMDEDGKETPRSNLSRLCNGTPSKTRSFHPTRSRIPGNDNLHIIIHQGGVCEGILTLVNGKACSGNLAGQMCEPQNWEQKRHSAGGDAIRCEKDECTFCEQEYSKLRNTFSNDR